jgi:hypothetical protein
MSAAQYTDIATILSKRGKMLRVSAVMSDDVPSVSVELRKGTDPFSKPDAKLMIGLDTLSMVLMAMANAGDVASKLAEEATGAKVESAGGVVAPGSAFVNSDIAEAMQGRGNRERAGG